MAAQTLTSVLFATSLALALLSTYLYNPHSFNPLLSKLGLFSKEVGVYDEDGVVNVTAFVGKRNVTTTECWTMKSLALGDMSTVYMGDITAATHTIFPRGSSFDGGTRPVTNPRFIVVLSGSATMSFPQSETPKKSKGKKKKQSKEETVKLIPGRLYVAADTAEVSGLGHHTLFEGGSKVLQLPINGGVEALGNKEVRPGNCYP